MGVRSSERSVVASSLAVLLVALTGCGGSPADGSQGAGDDWYYHFACNGDAECLATSPLPAGTPSGTINVGPVASNCTALQRFRTNFWGPSSWDACDHSPTFTAPGSGTPTIASVAPSAGIPGTQVTISGTNFPTGATGVTLDIGGVALPATTSVSTSGNVTLTFTVPHIASVAGPITVHTPGGQATSTAPFTVLNDLAAVAWSGTRFVAVGDHGTALTSPDGQRWTPQVTGLNPLAVPLFSVMWSGTKFISGGWNGYLISSPDGVTWTVPGSGLGMIGFEGLAYSGTQYVAVGSASGLALSSDGSTWTAASFGQPADAYVDAVWAGTQFVAVGFAIVTSPDGTTWTQTLAPSVSHTGIAWNGTTFVVVGSGGVVLTSPDAATWTPERSGTTATLNHVIWWNGKFIAVGAAGTILTSPDGVTWTPRASGVTQALKGVAGSGTTVVAVGNAGVTVSSSDGVIWGSTLPAAPTGVGASGRVDPAISWTPVTGATSYVVYASSSSAVSKTLYSKRVATSSTSAQVTGITANGTYWYFVVTAVNASGEGPPSGAIRVCMGVYICP
jgi:hypothetical protein